MKILMVGPGIMEIPSKGWGAVETVIWQLKIHLEKRRVIVDILNKRGFRAALKARPWQYDLVHLQYDDLASFWLLLSKIFHFRLAITSHYGYAAFPSKWHRSYRRIFRNLMRSEALIVLNSAIRDLYLKEGYDGFIEVLPNGTEVREIKFSSKGTKDLICLGKIEPRKNQKELSDIFSNQQELTIDFVGPIVDKRFRANNRQIFYEGVWSRSEVRERLTEYRALILLSDGEAHALVTGEALAAGLSLLISEEAAANLDLSLPFIQITSLKDPELIPKAKRLIEENAIHRETARRYVERNLDWDIIAEKYIMVAETFIKNIPLDRS